MEVKKHSYNTLILNRHIDYLIVFSLISISGNPFICFWKWASISLFIFFLIVLAIKGNLSILTKMLSKHSRYVAMFLLLFMFQQFFCKNISTETQLNYLIKILSSGLILLYYGKKFKYLYLNIMSFISLVSLILFPLVLLGFDFGNPFGTGLPYRGVWTIHSVIIYNFDLNWNFGRNFGMFWEPGAFACYICLTFVLFINDLRGFVLNNKKKVTILSLALLTTFSTTGFIVIALISFFVFKSTNKYIGPIIAAVVFALILSSDVVTQKIVKDLDVTAGMRLGERLYYEGYASANRLGSFMFLYQFFVQHPIIGNGLNPEALFSSMPYLLQYDNLGLGNGFMYYLASFGLLGLAIYLCGIWSYWRTTTRLQRILAMTIIIFLLQGEVLLNYPLFAGLPLLKH